MAKAYRATSTQKHGGKVFLAGELIPAEYMPPYSAQRLLSMGVITEAETENVTENGGNITFPILTNDGFVTEDVTAESLFDALIILQKNVEEASKAIEECTDESVLLMVKAIDDRKSVLNVIKKRETALNELLDEDAENAEDDLPEEQEVSQEDDLPEEQGDE